MNKFEKQLILNHFFKDSKYRYQVLILVCLIWGFVEMITVTVGTLEQRPIVTYNENGTTYDDFLSYEGCDKVYSIDYESQKYKSVVIYYQLYCSRYKVALIGGINFFGVFLSSFIIPYITDTFGRRKPSIYGLLIFGVSLIGASLSPDIYFFYIFLFICGFMNILTTISSYILLNESVDNEYRSNYSVYVLNSFSLFGIIFTWIYYYFDNWEILFYIGSFGSLVVSAISYYFLQESPRFLLENKDEKFIENARKEIRDDPETYEKLQSSQKLILVSKIYADENEDNDDFLTILKKRNLGKIFLIMCFLWMTVVGAYYGISIQIKFLNGNIFMISTMLYLSEIAANILSGYMMESEYFKRRKSLIYLYSLTCITYVILILVNEKGILRIVLVIILRFIIESIFSIHYVYTAEIFPTIIRSKGLSICSLFGRIGSVISPFLIEILGNSYFTFCLVLFSICLISVFSLSDEISED